MRTVLSALALAALATTANAAEQIRVACIGDSITAGASVDNAHAYPGQLQALLGSGYQVWNYGVGGSTLSDLDGAAYVRQGAWKNAQDFKPQIAVIMLGSNDSKRDVVTHADQLKDELERMVKTLQALDSKPQVVICLPCFVLDPGNYDIDEQRLVTKIIPEIQKAADELKLPVVDIHAVTREAATRDPNLLPDKVHPSADGYTIIAKAVRQELDALAKHP